MDAAIEVSSINLPRDNKSDYRPRRLLSPKESYSKRRNNSGFYFSFKLAVPLYSTNFSFFNNASTQSRETCGGAEIYKIKNKICSEFSFNFIIKTHDI